MSPVLRAQLVAVDAEKASRTPAQQKIDSQLLFAEKRARHVAFPPNFPDLQLGVQADASGQVRVDVQGRMTTGLLRNLRSADARITGQTPRLGALRVRLPLVNVEQVAASPGVTRIAPAETPQLAVGGATSEGDTTHRAATARSTYGVDGTGVKIGVLSDGVNSLATSQGSGDLPAVTVLPGQAGSGDEGTAMLEIVHDVAPGAQLFYATAANSAASFAQNIRDLRAAGCNIIVDDVFYFSEATFQDGPIAQAVNDVTADGALYFSSAGNSGNLDDGTSGAWEGNFVPVNDAGIVWADFDPSAATQDSNPLAAYSTTHRAVLQWADPLGASNNDYDLYLFDSTRTTILGVADNAQNGNDDPIEGMNVLNGAAGRLLAVRLFSGSARYLSINLNRGRWGSSGFATAGMISGHSAAANAFSVAATPAHDAFAAGQPAGPYPNPFSSSNVSETFTSDGPRRMFFAADGTPYTPGNFTASGGRVRQKPDLTAADGVATTVAGFQPFFGTSAAAPHAAALAALLLDAEPSASTSLVRTALTSTAIDIEAPGRDRDTGAGIINAPAAVRYVVVHPTALAATAPAAVNYNAVATIRATLTDTRKHAAIAGQHVTLQRRASASRPWANVRTVTTSSTGLAAVGVRMTANAQFRWTYAGAPTHQAAVSAAKAVAVRPVIGIARTATSIRKGATVKFYGTVKPTGTGQRVYLQRYVNHRWVTKTSVVIKFQRLPNGLRRTGYVLPIKLTVRGRYTFRVYKAATSTLAWGTSVSRSVKVT